MKEKNRLIHRSAAWLITAGVLAAVVLLNLLLTVFCGDKMIVDLTTEKFNEISEQSKAELDKIDPSENNITIYFLADSDELQSASFGSSVSSTGSYTNLWGMKYIWELAKIYAENYDFLSVQTLNIKKDADKLEEFRSTVGTEFTKLDVIIDNYTYEKDGSGEIIKDESGEPIMHHNFRKYKRDAFFVFESDSSYAYGFNGDEVITSAILSVAGKNPTVYFVSGHGEKIGDDTTLDASAESDYGKAQALRDLFFRAGFVTEKIDLSTEYKTLLSDDSARIIVIYGPDSDYLGAYDGGVDEIAVLRKFLNGIDHNGMFFLDGTAESLPNLSEYVEDYFGVTLENALVKDGGQNSLSSDGYTFISDYETDEYGVGTNLTDAFGDMESKPSAAFENAHPLKISDAFGQNNGFYDSRVTTTSGAVFLAPTSSAASADGKTSDEYTEETQPPLLVFSLLDKINSASRTDETSESYALICGTTDFASEKYIESAAYCNSDILYYTMRIMGKGTSSLSVDMKKIEGQSLSVTGNAANAWTVALCTVVPVLSLALGTVVFIKRRRS